VNDAEMDLMNHAGDWCGPFLYLYSFGDTCPEIISVPSNRAVPTRGWEVGIAFQAYSNLSRPSSGPGRARCECLALQRQFRQYVVLTQDSLPVQASKTEFRWTLTRCEFGPTTIRL
jgi:hypothetical protein